MYFARQSDRMLYVIAECSKVRSAADLSGVTCIHAISAHLYQSCTSVDIGGRFGID